MQLIWEMTAEGTRNPPATSVKDPLQARFALLDLSMISLRNDAAIAFLVTELDGKPYGGTAFGVTPTGLLVTNRHNVRSPLTGRAPTRLGVKYANTDVLLHAHVVQASPDSSTERARAFAHLLATR